MTHPLDPLSPTNSPPSPGFCAASTASAPVGGSPRSRWSSRTRPSCGRSTRTAPCPPAARRWSARAGRERDLQGRGVVDRRPCRVVRPRARRAVQLHRRRVRRVRSVAAHESRGLAALAKRGIDRHRSGLHGHLDLRRRRGSCRSTATAGSGWSDTWRQGRARHEPVRASGQRSALRHRPQPMEVLRVEDNGTFGSPPTSWGSTCRSTFPSASGSATARAAQTPGTSPSPTARRFTLDGNLLQWQNWSLRVGFNYREGMTLHAVRYQDGDRIRSIAHRLSFAEMVVPYRDPSVDHYRRTAFDIGEWGLGFMTSRWNSAATASARSATSTPCCTTARASRTPSPMRSASTKRTTPCSGSTSTTTRAPRCAGCAG